MLKWNFSPNIEETFLDYHMSSINEPEFSFSQIYRHQNRKPMTNDNYPLIKLEYSLDMDNSFEKTLYERKTCVSHFKNNQKINKQLISKFCNLAFIGGDGKRRKRNYPSGGSEYNIRIHILLNEKNVDSEMIVFGNIGEVNCDTGNLMIKKYEPWEKINTAFIQKYLADTAQFSIVLTVDLNSISKKYHDISYKLVQQEAGHIGQNIQLVSQYMGIQSVPLGSFYDTALNNTINEKQTVLYAFLLG
ncbi:nitroreductase family protein [Fictibacillus sp. KIGAM418]|uniref:Nitroreductase family protein n=1 Tax=Fictibacillus marinisediminis TaxID=2878389 RepID=A0A9X1XGY1_9BACL|nr:nitroreductase family protein [Fictibacillus marinisediminis]MCK6258795.1 nitroreductase family protein [Fictibacillus marinisediminis]